jgi:hypothetical protein
MDTRDIPCPRSRTVAAIQETIGQPGLVGAVGFEPTTR